jgi:hypothetical protein
MKPRNLKIEATGDFFAGRVTPKIRLCGKWLERAGFNPGERVDVTLTGPGEMTLRLMKHQPATGFESALARLTDAIAAAEVKS